MKIEEGKFFRTRDGRKVGPMLGEGKLEGGLTDKLGNGLMWNFDGTHKAWGMSDCDDLIAEWTDEPDTPTLWRDMTPEEKGALLLAVHEGREVEMWCPCDHDVPVWCEKGTTWSFGDGFAYRIKPEPKRETVTMWGQYIAAQGWHFSVLEFEDTHRITFDLIDGKPDCNSVKMEEL